MTIRKQKKLMLLLLLLTSFGVFMLIYNQHKIRKYIEISLEHNHVVHVINTTLQDEVIEITLPKFAVITQTAECIPADLISPDYFLDSEICDCHVYVLSYKKPCKLDANSSLSHVSYSYDNTVGWSGGRNIAYLEARRKKHKYLYYIFMDDDVILEYNSYTPTKFVDEHIPPFRIFTNFLLDYLPAGVGTDYEHWNKVDNVLERWHSTCNQFKTGRVLSVSHIDPCFSAFHRNTVDIVLPYAEVFDNTSFWLSGIQVSMNFEVAFHGQLVYFPEIRALNPEHRYNKTGYEHDMNIRRKMVVNLLQRTPCQYKGHSIFKELYRFPEIREETTLCMEPPPPRSPIVPYRVMHHSFYSNGSLVPSEKYKC